MVTHSLGFPRMGLGRELKTALEAYWSGRLDAVGLETTAAALRLRHWTLQRAAGIDLVPVGDFSLYDHLLDTALAFGVIPPRHGRPGDPVDLEAYFRLARGGGDVTALEMTKWFDTNYHYLVPELAPDQTFRPDASRLLGQLRQALDAGFTPKAVLPGPLTFLHLCAVTDPGHRPPGPAAGAGRRLPGAAGQPGPAVSLDRTRRTDPGPGSPRGLGPGLSRHLPRPRRRRRTGQTHAGHLFRLHRPQPRGRGRGPAGRPAPGPGPGAAAARPGGQGRLPRHRPVPGPGGRTQHLAGGRGRRPRPHRAGRAPLRRRPAPARPVVLPAPLPGGPRRRTRPRSDHPELAGLCRTEVPGGAPFGRRGRPGWPRPARTGRRPGR